ncbi:MAG: ATP-binding protein [Thermoprotei archaeon]|nr:MAG: ATP-binding protein [Thermoprotei archaeon]
MLSEKIDPRDLAIEKKFRNIKRSLLVLSGKGGVGKSIISTTISLLLANKGYKTGLLDLDLHGPVIPTIFSLEHVEPEESKHGLIPPQAYGVKVMSLAFFAKDEPLPLRGKSKVDAIKEVLAITNWGNLDFLVVDMPPGTGDEVLTAARYVRNERIAVVVTTPSKLSVSVILRTMNLLKDLKIPIIALINNMAYLNINEKMIRIFGKIDLENLANKFNVRTCIELPIEPQINEILEIGDAKKLLDTIVASKLKELIEILEVK